MLHRGHDEQSLASEDKMGIQEAVKPESGAVWIEKRLEPHRLERVSGALTHASESSSICSERSQSPRWCQPTQLCCTGSIDEAACSCGSLRNETEDLVRATVSTGGQGPLFTVNSPLR